MRLSFDLTIAATCYMCSIGRAWSVFLLNFLSSDHVESILGIEPPPAKKKATIKMKPIGNMTRQDGREKLSHHGKVSSAGWSLMKPPCIVKFAERYTDPFQTVKFPIKIVSMARGHLSKVVSICATILLLATRHHMATYKLKTFMTLNMLLHRKCYQLTRCLNS